MLYGRKLQVTITTGWTTDRLYKQTLESHAPKAKCFTYNPPEAGVLCVPGSLFVTCVCLTDKDNRRERKHERKRKREPVRERQQERGNKRGTTRERQQDRQQERDNKRAHILDPVQGPLESQTGAFCLVNPVLSGITDIVTTALLPATAPMVCMFREIDREKERKIGCKERLILEDMYVHTVHK